MLGREDFPVRNAALGSVVDDAAWYQGQLAFLGGHRYFAASARTLRDEGKRRNEERLRALPAACAGSEPPRPSLP